MTDQVQVIHTDLLRTMPLPEFDDKAGRKPLSTVLVLAGSPHQPGPVVLAARAALRTGCAVIMAAPEDMALHMGLAVPEAASVAVAGNFAGSAEEILKSLRKQFSEWGATLLLERAAEQKSVKSGAALTSVLKVSGQQVETGQRTVEAAANWQEQAQQQDAVLVSLNDGEGRAAVFSATGSYQVDEDSPATLSSGGIEVLGGIVTALLARGLEPAHAAVWGLHLFTLALEAATKDFGDEGVLASDIIRYIPGSLRYARRTTGTKKETTAAGFRRSS